jgi:hypothetical protein
MPEVKLTPGEGSRSGRSSPRKALAKKTGAPFLPMALVGVRDLDFDHQAVALGIPAVDVRPLYSLRERQRFGVEQGHEIRVSLFQAVF